MFTTTRRGRAEGLLTALGGLAVAAALAGIWSSQAPRIVSPYARHPVAVLAWAQANCKNVPALRTDAPRTHTDTILEVAGMLDVAKTSRPLAELCADALRIVAPVAEASQQQQAGHPLARVLATLTTGRAAD